MNEINKEFCKILNKYNIPYSLNKFSNLFNPVSKKNNVEENAAVLVFGINPSGDDNAIIQNQQDYIYLNHVDGITGKKDYINNNYFLPILNLCNSVFDNDVKWDWCNLDWDQIDSRLKKTLPNNEYDKYIKTIKAFYNKNKDKKTTIYVGDLIYYHETEQNTLINLLKPIVKQNDFNNYVLRSLDYHINLLSNYGLKKLYIYINNRTVSEYIAKALNISFIKKGLSCYNYKKDTDNLDCKIFFGKMLSGKGTRKAEKEDYAKIIKNNL